jgi:hypothetical protein
MAMDLLLTVSGFAAGIPISLFLLVLWWFYRRDKKSKTLDRRGMFCFNDGKADRWVDPIQVMMAFERHPEYRADIHGKLALEGRKDAIDILIDAVKKAFLVQEYTSPNLPGLTISEMIDLWYSFYAWVDLQKKSMQFEQTFAEFTAQTQKRSEKPTTNSMSGFGSTETGQLPSMQSQ